jgi:RimJ/RimL family protein N-acetyltransferase
VHVAVADRACGALYRDCAVRVATEQPHTAEVGANIHPVYGQADDRNLAVHRLFERLGFRCEARLVEADWFKGEWTTLRTYALLRREWELG